MPWVEGVAWAVAEGWAWGMRHGGAAPGSDRACKAQTGWMRTAGMTTKWGCYSRLACVQAAASNARPMARPPLCRHRCCALSASMQHMRADTCVCFRAASSVTSRSMRHRRRRSLRPPTLPEPVRHAQQSARPAALRQAPQRPAPRPWSPVSSCTARSRGRSGQGLPPRHRPSAAQRRRRFGRAC